MVNSFGLLTNSFNHPAILVASFPKSCYNSHIKKAVSSNYLSAKLRKTYNCNPFKSLVMTLTYFMDN